MTAIIVATVPVWVIAFVLTATLTSAPSPWAVALGIATGTKDPFDAAPGARGVGAVLAVWSWLLVPVGVGTFVAVFLQDAMRGGTLRAEPPTPTPAASTATDPEAAA